MRLEAKLRDRSVAAWPGKVHLHFQGPHRPRVYGIWPEWAGLRYVEDLSTEDEG